MPQSLPRAILCIASKNSLSANSLRLFTKGRTGIIAVKQCATMSQVLAVVALKQNIILALDENFNGYNCTIGSIQNLVNTVNPVATILFCNDGNPQRLSDLVALNFLGYILKTQPCDIIRQNLTYLLKGIKLIDSKITASINELTSEFVLYHGIHFKRTHYVTLLLIMQGVKPAAIPSRIGKSKYTYYEYREGITQTLKKAGYNNLNQFLKFVNENEKKE